MKYIAFVKIRSGINADAKIKHVMNLLGLNKKNTLIVLEDTPSIRGNVHEVKDYITYGVIEEDFLEEVAEKRGTLFTKRLKDSKDKIAYTRFLTINKKKYNSHFALHPPRGGFERKGIKKTFLNGGALGDRKEKIKDLLVKML